MTNDLKSMLELLAILLCGYAVYKERELCEFERKFCRLVKCLVKALIITVKKAVKE